jgi:hypothetical protein
MDTPVNTILFTHKLRQQLANQVMTVLKKYRVNVDYGTSAAPDFGCVLALNQQDAREIICPRYDGAKVTLEEIPRTQTSPASAEWGKCIPEFNSTEDFLVAAILKAITRGLN